jgi:SprT protein
LPINRLSINPISEPAVLSNNASPSSVLIVTPINVERQLQVHHEVQRYLAIGASLYQCAIPSIPVLFDLKGKTAGMYRVKISIKHRKGFFSKADVVPDRVIRFNPWLFAKYPEDSWENTIPHEVAHYITDCLYGIKTIRPHGKEWGDVMGCLGAEPIVRANYDLSGIPTRRMAQYAYRCACREVNLTAYRHKKVQNGLQRYRCRDCVSELSWINS